MMLSTKATGAEFTICASGNVSYVRRRGKDGAAMAGSSRANTGSSIDRTRFS
jgi:hypothetical protein